MSVSIEAANIISQRLQLATTANNYNLDLGNHVKIVGKDIAEPKMDAEGYYIDPTADQNTSVERTPQNATNSNIIERSFTIIAVKELDLSSPDVPWFVLSETILDDIKKATFDNQTIPIDRRSAIESIKYELATTDKPKTGSIYLITEMTVTVTFVEKFGQ